MLARTLLMAAAAGLFVGFPGNLRADEKAVPSPRLHIVGPNASNGAGDGFAGYCNGSVVFVKDRGPLVCFGLTKSPGEKEKYLYILLFKNYPSESVGDGIHARAIGDADSGESLARITLGKKTVEIAYNCTRDEKTHALKSEMLKVGDAVSKEGSPRVFLVDLAQEKVSYRPIKVDLPEEIPAFHKGVPKPDSEEGRAWASTALRAVEQLKKKSPEVKNFLEP